MVATLAFFGFACGEFGKRLPVLGKLGAAAICATFIPSALVHYGLLPEVVVESTTKFYKSTNILYLYICCIIVGSIMSMNRTTLIQGFLRIFFPMLCGEIVGMVVGVAITPWQELVNAFTVTNLLVIISTVTALVATGFLVGKKIGMYPIDVAIVSCCQSGQGGTGDVAILTSGNRMNLMPFAQIATRIGGAINVSLGLLFLSHFLA